MTGADWSDPDDEPAFPGVVRVAGWLGLLGGVAVMLAGVGLCAWAVVDRQKGGACCPGGVIFLAGWTVQWNARRLATGRTADVSGFAGWALVWAAAGVGVAGWLFWAGGLEFDSPGGLLAGVAGGAAVGLAVPAVMALGGRRAYLVWRHRPGASGSG